MRILCIIMTLLLFSGNIDAGDRCLKQIDTHSEEQTEDEQTENNLRYWGNCTITFYCNCSACCGVWAGGGTASGTIPTAGRTVANNVLPYGTRVLIDGHEYIVEDCGGSIMDSGMWFDVYVNSHDEANARGMYQADVYIVEDKR